MLRLSSPIWMHRLAGPMHTFVAQNYSKLRGVAVVTVTGRSGASNAVAEITALLGRRRVLEVSFLAREVESGSIAIRVAAFARAVERDVADAGFSRSPAACSPTAG